MLCVLISVFELLSDVEDTLSALVPTVDAEDSSGTGSWGGIFEDTAGVIVLDESSEAALVLESRSRLGRLCNVCVDGDSAARIDGVGMGKSIGSSSCVSLIVMTIFSRSHDVMCFSHPLLLLSHRLKRLNSGRACGREVGSLFNSSSESSESRLEERAGTPSGMLVEAASGRPEEEPRGKRAVDRACEAGLQQKVSRFHKRQLKFSNRLPSSIACEVLENNDHCDGC